MSGAGLVLVLLALTGGPGKLAGVEIPTLADLRLRVAVGAVGGCLLLATAAIWLVGGASVAIHRERQITGLPPRNRRFVGRTELLAELRSTLVGKGVRGCVLQGSPGIGKTQLAVEHAHRESNRYELICWLRADQVPTMVEQLAGLGTALGLAESQDRQTAARAVLRELSRRSDWLVVFDNVASPEDLAEWWPSGGSGHVIVTSRRAGFEHLAPIVVVPVMTRAESVALLTHWTRAERSESIAELAQELDDLPLALEQAGAYIAESGLPPDEYLTNLRRAPHLVLDRGTAASYSGSLAGVTSMAVSWATETDPTTAAVLGICTFMNPDDVQLALLGMSGDADLADPLERTDAVGVLVRSALVKIGDNRDSLSLHRLTQTLIRGSLDRGEAGRWCASAVKALATAFPAEVHSPEVWLVCRRLLPHVLEVATHAVALSISLGELAGLVDRATNYLRDRGDLRFAAKLIDMVPAHDDDSRELARLLRSRAKVLVDLGRSTEALAILEHALVLDRATNGDEHSPEVADDFRELANALAELGRFYEAKAYLERAVQIRTAIYGANHWRTTWLERELGRVLRKTGDVAGARTILEHALTADQASFGADHWGVAVIHRELARVLRDTGDLDGAMAHMIEAHAGQERVNGPKHWTSAWMIRERASLMRERGQLRQACRDLRRALSIDTSTLGPNDWRVGEDLRELATTLRRMHHRSTAKKTIMRAIVTHEAAFGSAHWRTAEDLRELGRIQREEGEFASACRAFEDACAVDTAAVGKDDWRVGEDLRELATTLRLRGEYTAAEMQIRSAISIHQRSLPSTHRQVTADQRELTAVLVARNREAAKG